MDHKPNFKLHPKKEHLESYDFESFFMRKAKESGYNGHRKAPLLAFFRRSSVVHQRCTRVCQLDAALVFLMKIDY